ncbi:hypothetical protein N6H14_30585 [Paenibacillus sp. CC-CFT747]|nr:hypothetical protein N6H14_30585 [Paenibacillus sp. CC-CFT747]
MIDFKKLKDYNVLSTIPGNAFENGGTALYVLVDVETSPKVKMMDLPSYQRMVDLQKEIDAYKAKNQGALPKGQPLAEGFSYIDYTKLKKKELSLQSPYSRTSLSAIMDDTGKVGIDYGPEIAKAMSRKGLTSADPGKDLRSLLVEEGYFVPARSFPYTWKNGEPTVTRE